MAWSGSAASTTATAGSGSTARLVPWRDAEVHVLTHALHYASSVFEGQRAYNGEIFKLDEHSERLRKSASLLGFELPWSVEEINAACKRGAEGQRPHRRLHAPGRLARRGIDGRVAPARPSRTWRSPPGNGANITTSANRENGIRLDIAPWRRPAPYTAPTASKAAGLYMICTLSQQHAEERGYRRCADVRLARAGGRSDRRQRLLRPRRRAPHADPRLLPRRDHPPDGDGPRAAPRDRGDRARDLARGARELRADVPRPAPRSK